MYKQAFLATVLAVATLSTSCKKDDNQVIDYVEDGNWRITLYNDSGTDELYHFTGYTFTFADGTATATKSGATTVTGTYANGTDDSHATFVLNFGAITPFDELNDDWHIVEQTSTKIRLEDVSGGSGETDLLTFEKL